MRLHLCSAKLVNQRLALRLQRHRHLAAAHGGFNVAATGAHGRGRGGDDLVLDRTQLLAQRIYCAIGLRGGSIRCQ